MKPRALLPAALLAAACAEEPRTAPAGPTVVVDSAIPIAVAVERFRAELPEAPSGLKGGYDSKERVVRALSRALAVHDTAALERLTLERAEWAYLYYESSPLAKPPYELPPALAWFQMQGNNRIGALRLLREFGGKGLGDAAIACPDRAVKQGDNRIWSGCLVAGRRLFGALIEREGTFKILSYANSF